MKRADSHRRPNLWLYAVPLALFVAQVAVGTALTFAAWYLVYFVTVIFSFRVLGGFRSVGGLIVFVSTSRNLVGQIVKVYLGQPADSYLASPQTSVMLLASGACVVALAAVVSRHLLPPGKGILAAEVESVTLKEWVVLFYGLRMLFFVSDHTSWLPSDFLGGAFAGIVSNLGFLSTLCVALGTGYHLVISDRQRSLGWANVPHLAIAVLETLQWGWKITIVFPTLAYFLTCFLYKKKYRAYDLIGLALAAVVVGPVTYIYSQVARSVATQSYGQSAGAVLLNFAMTDVDTKLQDILDAVEVRAATNREVGYFGAPMGVLDRVVAPLFNGAQVVRAVETRGDLGIEAVGAYFTFLPKSLTGVVSKFQQKGDVIAQYVGIIDASNANTGIEVDMMISACIFGGWAGSVILIFLAYSLLFSVSNVAFGSTESNPWASTAIVSACLAVTSTPVAFAIVWSIRWVPFLLITVFVMGRFRKRRRERRRPEFSGAPVAEEFAVDRRTPRAG